MKIRRKSYFKQNMGQIYPVWEVREHHGEGKGKRNEDLEPGSKLVVLWTR